MFKGECKCKGRIGSFVISITHPDTDCILIPGVNGMFVNSCSLLNRPSGCLKELSCKLELFNLSHPPPRPTVVIVKLNKGQSNRDITQWFVDRHFVMVFFGARCNCILDERVEPWRKHIATTDCVMPSRQLEAVFTQSCRTLNYA